MKRQAGFTLVELAIVVFLIGLLATMSLTALKAQLASAAISATKKKEETIKDALVAYLAKNRRLPCPAVDASGGLDATVRLNAIPQNCKTNFGIVPYAELGLPKSAALDGWENFFTYAVSPKWTVTFTPVAPSCIPAVGMSSTCDATSAFNVGSTGAITVNTSTAVVVLVSHGVNGAGAYTSKGTQNAPPTAATDEFTNMPPANLLATPAANAPGLIQRDYTDNASAPGGAFDDIVTWLSPNDLLSPLIKDGALQSAQGQWVNLIANIKNSIVDSVLSSCTVPSVLQTIYATGPWGETITYSRLTDKKLSFSGGPAVIDHYDASGVPATSAIFPTATLYTLTDASGVPAAPNQLNGPTVGWLLGAYQYLQTQCP